MKKIKEVFNSLTPVLLSANSNSLTLSISKRFFIFKILNNIVNLIEKDPNLSFVSLLKSYKILGKLINGTIEELHRDKNKLYFKKFFIDEQLYEIVKADIEYFYPKYKNVKLTITKRGVMIYDNYKINSFNVLLLTAHSGRWIDENIRKKLVVPKEKVYSEEDIDTDRIYCKIVLDNHGIWIDNKQSRFGIDFNRQATKAIYKNNSEKWLNFVWGGELTKKEEENLHASYKDFYFTLSKLVDIYKFNIIFDGHSMKSDKGRPNFSFGTKYIPSFYMPIVKEMQKQLRKIGYKKVLFNTPYKGGYILKWLKIMYPNTFICSMEINKCMYMSKDMQKSYKSKVNKLQKDIPKMFNI